MFSSSRSLGLVLVLAAGLSGCANRKIPGTEIPDTQDTRAVIEVVDKYRMALERKDSDAIIALLSESFRDTGGTGTSTDDLEYRDMREILPKRFAQIDTVKADFNIRTVEIEGDVANVVYHFDAQYQLLQFKTRPSRQTDLQQMWLKRVGGVWKIVSGI